MGYDLRDTTYSGTYSPYMIMRATFGMDTIQKKLVYVKGDIRKLHTIKRIDYSKPLRKRQAVPVPSANATPFTIDGRQIIPKDVDIYEEFNPRDLEATELSEQLSNTVLDREVPATVESQMTQLVLNRAGEKYEEGLWIGSTAYMDQVDEADPRYQYQYFDGFLTRMVNDPLIRLSTISPVTITKSNVLDIMNDLIGQCTKYQKALITAADTFMKMKFIVGPTTANLYVQANATGFVQKGIALDEGTIPKWQGYTVERVAGVPDDTILFVHADDTTESNLWAGMNSMADWDLKLARTAPANETFFIQGKFKWDCNYGWSEEIFLYTVLTQASFKP